MRKSIKTLLIVTGIILIHGCSDEATGNANCDSQINNLIKQSGQPEEINKYDSSGYHSHTYWYWCAGFSRDFTWGDNVTNCEVSDYTFAPICN